MIALGPVSDPRSIEMAELVGQRMVICLRNGRVLGASGQAAIEKVYGDTVIFRVRGGLTYMLSARTIKSYVLVTTPDDTAFGRNRQ